MPLFSIILIFGACFFRFQKKPTNWRWFNQFYDAAGVNSHPSARVWSLLSTQYEGWYLRVPSESSYLQHALSKRVAGQYVSIVGQRNGVCRAIYSDFYLYHQTDTAYSQKTLYLPKSKLHGSFSRDGIPCR